MKKILFLMAGLLLAMNSAANATTTCTAAGHPGEPTVEIESRGNGYYMISMYGHSRNTYKALYEATENSSPFLDNGVQASSSLEKIEDLSTWQDMPPNLYLAVYHDNKVTPEFTASLYGLAHKKWVIFKEDSDCENKGDLK